VLGPQQPVLLEGVYSTGTVAIAMAMMAKGTVSQIHNIGN